MFRCIILITLLNSFAVCFSAEPVTVKTDTEPLVRTWTVPAADAVRSELAAWIGENKLPASWQTLWQTAEKLSGTDLFDLTIRTLRQSSDPVAKYFDACDALAWQGLPFGQQLALPMVPIQIHVGDTGTRFLYGTLRHYRAVRLVQSRFFDEAGTVLDELTPENSIDPAGVLVTRAVICSQLADMEAGRTALKEFQTLTKKESVPRRYTELAKLLQFDMEKKENDPEKISNKMNDVRRRLGQGRTDDDTQQAEDGVMKSLDKLIEKIEEQAKKQQQMQESDQGQQGNQPANDSRLLKQKGPGNVDRRDFVPGDTWGDLPPKDRDDALLKIEKDFPPYYRDIIEQYFREMAK
jgi:hypothetical protein